MWNKTNIFLDFKLFNNMKKVEFSAISSLITLTFSSNQIKLWCISIKKLKSTSWINARITIKDHSKEAYYMYLYWAAIYIEIS